MDRFIFGHWCCDSINKAVPFFRPPAPALLPHRPQRPAAATYRRRRPLHLAGALPGLGQHPGRNAGKLLRRRAEPALPGPVPGPRNGAALQHVQVLRSGYRAVYQPGPDWVGGWYQPVPVRAGAVWVGGSVGVGTLQDVRS